MNTGDTEMAVTTDQLHAYVDNQLTASQRATVEAYLETHPDAAKQVADWSKQNDQLRSLYGEAIPEPTNVAAYAALRDQGTRPQATSTWRIAAALALFIGGAASGFALHPVLAPQQDQFATVLLDDAFSAHRVYVADPHRPVEIRANEEELLVTWLSRRIGTQLAAPNLNPQGFDLVGGRLLAGETGPAALFMYENATGHRVTVFVSTEQVQEFASFRFEERNGLSAAHWTEDNLQFAVVGELDRDLIRTMAVEVYRQII